jgi:RND family efflux transporter MFP subunit
MHARFRYLLFTPGLLLLVGATPADDDKPAAPVKVEVSQPLALEVVDHGDFTGRTAAVEAATIRARVSGTLDKVVFKAGTTVKQGELLFQIDPRPYQAELDRADAEVVRYEAKLKRAATDLDRMKRLVDAKTIAREEVDRIQSDYAEAEASLRAARAARDLARLNVEFTRVTAPINGHIGRPLLTTGNFVQAGTTDLTTIVSSDPMHFYFEVDERTALRLRRLAREGKLKEMGAPVNLGLADEKGFPHRGTIDFVDNQLDPATRTLRLRAVFANADHVLIPGLFARVRLIMGAPYKALLVPERALVTDQGQAYLFVATDRNVAERRALKLGARNDTLRVVIEGIKAEEWVILSGLDSVKNGAAVEPKRVSISVQPQAPEKPGSNKPASSADRQD